MAYFLDESQQVASLSMNYGFRVGFLHLQGVPDQRIKPIEAYHQDYHQPYVRMSHHRLSSLARSRVMTTHSLSYVVIGPHHRATNQRMKLSWRGGRWKGKEFVLMAAAAPRSLCAIR
jgi:hypothetical protein